MPSIIPLDGGESNANYSISVTLGDYAVILELHYQQNGQWFMHVISDGDSGELPVKTVDGVDYIAMGLMLESGMDIIGMYNIKKIFGQLFFVGEEANLNNLGTGNELVWFSPEEAISW